MQPGRVIAHAVEFPNLSQPFFLLGTDPLSQRWLAQNRARLLELHAMGLVVEAAGAADYARLQALAGALPLAPVVGTDIAQALGVDHYPVLVTAAGIEVRRPDG